MIHSRLKSGGNIFEIQHYQKFVMLFRCMKGSFVPALDDALGFGGIQRVDQSRKLWQGLTHLLDHQ